MKILQINSLYNSGSTGKIVADIHNELIKQDLESMVCYGRGEQVNEKNVYKVCSNWYAKLNNGISRITGVMYGGCGYSTKKLIGCIKKEKPDVVHLHCINGYFVNIYMLIEFLKKEGIPTVLTLHAEFMYTANCGYAFDCEQWKTGCGNCPCLKRATKSIMFDRTGYSWNKMKRAFENFDQLRVISVSPWLMNRAKQSPILGDKTHGVVLNGLDISVFTKYETSELRRKLNISEDKKIVFHATPFFNLDKDHIKGGYYVTKLAESVKNEAICFVVAGNYDKEATYPSNIIFLGNVSDQVELAKLYSMADVTVLTSKKETFSMICAESLCCGTPVVGFKAGAPEMISLKEYSMFSEYGDIETLRNNMFEYMTIKMNEKDIDKAHKEYSSKRMSNQYIDCYKEVLDKR